VAGGRWAEDVIDPEEDPMRTVAALVLCVAVISACSDDEATFCENRSELGDSIQSLRDVNVLDDGIDALDEQLDTVQSDVEALRSSAGELQPEVDAVRTSITTLSESFDAAATPAAKADALVSGLADVSASFDALTEASGAQCD
jgi:uncharacterized phage infection (PIP) family protein YhgE